MTCTIINSQNTNLMHISNAKRGKFYIVASSDHTPSVGELLLKTTVGYENLSNGQYASSIESLGVVMVYEVDVEIKITGETGP